MNPIYEQTQIEIKQWIRKYVDASPLTASQISIKLMHRSDRYLRVNMAPSRIIGMSAFEHMAKVIPFPQGLRDRAEAEYQSRLRKRGMRISATHRGAPWMATVAAFKSTKPVQHQVWRAAS